MAGRNPQKVDRAAKQLSEYGDRIQTVIVEVTNQKQVENAIKDAAVEKVGWICYLTTQESLNLCCSRQPLLKIGNP